MIAKLWNSAIN